MPSKPIPIRLSPQMLNDIRRAALALGSTDQDTMRLSMMLGLKLLELSSHDTVTPVIDKVMENQKKTPTELIKFIQNA